MTPHVSARMVVLTFVLAISGCNSAMSPPPLPSPALDCSNISSTALNHYDQMAAASLDESTRHPTTNVDGEVVWNTRYYLESLLIAYNATGNAKYLQAFLDSATSVMNLVQTVAVLDVRDPTYPGTTGNTIQVTGWPTQLTNFAAPVPVPTTDGAISLYAQSLTPSGGAQDFQVTQQSDGSLQLAWLDENNQPLQTFTVKSLADLQTIGSQPLFFIPANAFLQSESLGRIIPTGAGLPAPGLYLRGDLEGTIWSMQSGGILLPFVEFLLLAQNNPQIAPASTVAQWTSTVVSIATSYEDEFIPDGSGGLRFHNPQWLPNPVADMDTPADYIFVEARLRLLLYKLTGDVHNLAIAQGLTRHQQALHWQATSNGWLELKFWPCAISWTNRSEAPAGSIWDTFQYDSTSPAPAQDASYVADFLRTVENYRFAAQLGIDPASLQHQQAAFTGYMLRGPGSAPLVGSQGIMRANFPTAASTVSDPVVYSDDFFAPAAWTPQNLSDEFFGNVYWNWMTQYGLTPGNNPVGYFLRAWARAEAAEVASCKAKH